jgi:uracil-DNA glycosylase
MGDIFLKIIQLVKIAYAYIRARKKPPMTEPSSRIITQARALTPSEADLADCHRCGACEARQEITPGEGNSGGRVITRTKALALIEADLTKDCRRCGLCEARQKVVFGEGNANAELVFVGEGPGADEDLWGRPFVGRAGKLLDRMIQAMGFPARESVYIANVVKCRPPGNRYPTPEEVSCCFQFLRRQLLAIEPRVIVTLGNLATQTLLGVSTGITAMRGKWREWEGIRVMPTYHPAYALRDGRAKKPMWRDMKKVLRALGKE